MNATSLRKDLPDAGLGMSICRALRHGQVMLGGGADHFREAEILLGDLLGVDRVALHRDDVQIGRPTLDEYEARLSRRASGEPIQYIVGYVEFLGFRISVGPGVLVPRPETELWLSELLERWTTLSDRTPRRIVDLCTGSGCLALGLSRTFPDAEILAVDRSERALAYARENVGRSNVGGIVLLCSDLLSAFGPGRVRADLLVCNPPYISRNDYGSLFPTVRDWEPEEALVGGEDGLGCYRLISRNLRDILGPGAVVALEVGSGQGQDVSVMLEEAGIADVSVYRDLAGHDRAVFGVWP